MIPPKSIPTRDATPLNPEDEEDSVWLLINVVKMYKQLEKAKLKQLFQ